MQTTKQQQARSEAIVSIFYTAAAIAGAANGVMTLPAGTSALVMAGTGLGLFLFTIGFCALFSGLWAMVTRK